MENGLKRGTIGIIQSNYIPWKGYFDFINSVERFVLLDDVKYRRGDWRNRNRIKTAHGTRWLTIPIQSRGRFTQKIREAAVVDTYWTKKHWLRLAHSYSGAPCFQKYRDLFAEIYEQAGHMDYLTDINYLFTKTICRLLGINTSIHRSCDLEMIEGKNERLIGICKQLGASHYVSGPAASGYLDEQLFGRNGIEVSILDYGPYRQYDQVFAPFEHGVSVLDLLFHTGDEATAYMNSFGTEPRVAFNSLQCISV